MVCKKKENNNSKRAIIRTTEIKNNKRVQRVQENISKNPKTKQKTSLKIFPLECFIFKVTILFSYHFEKFQKIEENSLFAAIFVSPSPFGLIKILFE